MISDMFGKKVLIFGCGNTLFGNDGFGPAVIEHLHENYVLPGWGHAMDVGTCIRDIMFDLILAEEKPEMLIVVDAVTVEGKEEGQVFEMDLDDVPREKMSDFSLHQSPSSNLLKELMVSGKVEVRVLGLQTEYIPNEINPGLSQKVAQAVPAASQWIMDRLTEKSIEQAQANPVCP